MELVKKMEGGERERGEREINFRPYVFSNFFVGGLIYCT
jgi:hypothetical protein